MKVIKTEISGVDVLIQTEDNEDIIIKDYTAETSADVEAIQVASDDLLAVQSIKGGEIISQGMEKIKNAMSSSMEATKEKFQNASNVIHAFAEDCKKLFYSYDYAPNELEVEYSLSLSGDGKLWKFVSAGAKASINVRMKWEKNKPIQQQGGSK
jgi:hypothetical protein